MTVEFDTGAAHRHFSTDCFNGVWALLDKPVRSADEDRLMVSMCHASLYHWQQRADCTPRNLSMGCWLLSRVYAVLGQPETAREYAKQCHIHGKNEGPFYIGYGWEALARATFSGGCDEEGEFYLAKGREAAAKIEDASQREMLEKDLAFVRDAALWIARWTNLELNVMRDALIAEISDAFRDVSRTGGVSWSQSDVIDSYGDEDEQAEAREKDTDTHWSEVVADEKWSSEPGVGGFSFLDSIGFRYYLPAAMIRSLRSGWDEGIQFHLDNNSAEFRSFNEQKQSLLDHRQRICVARFLLYMMRKTESVGCPDADWLKALNSEWRPYLNPEVLNVKPSDSDDHQTDV